MNPNWIRWIHATLNTYVKTQFNLLNIIFYFEPQSREQISNQSDYVEFSWNGPTANQVSRNYWYIDINLNFIVMSTTNRADTYTHKKVVGLVQSILTSSLNVYNDNDELFGCLQIKPPIQTIYFGRFADPIEMEETTIEASYCMRIRT